MLKHEFEELLKNNVNIKVEFDEEYAYCRNETLLWYQEDPDRATRIVKKVFYSMTPSQLVAEINRGLQVEQIARVTGYFSKVSSWNKGKVGELNDRPRDGGNFFTSISSSPFSPNSPQH